MSSEWVRTKIWERFFLYISASVSRGVELVQVVRIITMTNNDKAPSDSPRPTVPPVVFMLQSIISRERWALCSESVIFVCIEIISQLPIWRVNKHVAQSGWQAVKCWLWRFTVLEILAVTSILSVSRTKAELQVRGRSDWVSNKSLCIGRLTGSDGISNFPSHAKCHVPHVDEVAHTWPCPMLNQSECRQGLTQVTGVTQLKSAGFTIAIYTQQLQPRLGRLNPFENLPWHGMTWRCTWHVTGQFSINIPPHFPVWQVTGLRWYHCMLLDS